MRTGRSQWSCRGGTAPLTPYAAADLREQLVGAERVTIEPEAVVALTRLRARRPLALRRAAAMLADRPQHGIADQAGRSYSFARRSRFPDRPTPAYPRSG